MEVLHKDSGHPKECSLKVCNKADSRPQDLHKCHRWEGWDKVSPQWECQEDRLVGNSLEDLQGPEWGECRGKDHLDWEECRVSKWDQEWGQDRWVGGRVEDRSTEDKEWR